MAGGISPISSSRIVPPEAASNSPRWSCVAPVKAPRRWPKSSLSRSDSGSAAQLTATKGSLARALAAWMPRATSSLPVPVSPSIRTAIGDAAALSISRKTEAMGAPVPIMGSKLPRRARSRRNTPTWARSCSAEAFSCSQRRALLDRHRHAPGQRGEQGEIAVAEGSAAAAVHDLDHARACHAGSGAARRGCSAC